VIKKRPLRSLILCLLALGALGALVTCLACRPAWSFTVKVPELPGRSETTDATPTPAGTSASSGAPGVSRTILPPNPAGPTIPPAGEASRAPSGPAVPGNARSDAPPARATSVALILAVVVAGLLLGMHFLNRSND
jgi:hypothetical protein